MKKAKKTKSRITAMLLAVMCCMAAFSVGAFAYEDDPGIEPEETETSAVDYYASDESDTDTEIPDAIDVVNIDTADVEVESEDPLTPDGNMTLVDDTDSTSGAYSSSESGSKQFMTVKTKNGNTFYLIIDHSSDTDNVYFLNLVDESDLMALIDSDDSISIAECTCDEKCAVGGINTECEVCKVNMSACEGKEAVVETPAVSEVTPAETADTETEETAKSSGSNFLPILLILLAGGGGAVWYLKFRKPKADTKGNTDIDDYDYGTDEEDEDEGDDLDEVEYENEDEE